MIKKIKDIDINYVQYGTGKDVVLLHGWGQNIQMMDPLGKLLKNCRITILDLPGFGSSMEPSFAYNISDYASLLHEFFKELKIDNPILIGHSFGGRIAIYYASTYPVSKLVLFGSPFIKRENDSLKLKVFKSLKKIKFLNNFAEVMKNHLGSEDYKNASGVMRQILVNTVNTDLSSNASKITCPTHLIWGNNDEAVPVSEAKKLESLIDDSALIVLNGTHYCYLENLNHISCILENFF
ncbi:MAG: alpha/beta hydrolase [Erysipelotrichaceae bacterium]|nr:alpha/beta hydrolase [Erysipelotrichaceae bacterium]